MNGESCKHEWRLARSKQYRWTEQQYDPEETKKGIFGGEKIEWYPVEFYGRIDEFYCVHLCHSTPNGDSQESVWGVVQSDAVLSANGDAVRYEYEYSG